MMGLLVAVFVLVFGTQVQRIAVPAIAAVLIVAGIGVYRYDAIMDIWNVSLSSRIVMMATFLSTLVLEIQQAVFIGVVLSMLDFVYTSAQEVQLVELLPLDRGLFQERPGPDELLSERLTILYAWGALFFASARTIEEMLPDVAQAKRPVVILRLHGRARIGSTFVQILERYATRVRTNGGKLLLSGVSQRVWDQLASTETFAFVPEQDVFKATEILGDSTERAIRAAKEWLAAQEQDAQQGAALSS
jgi:SulP family sulfate permease